MHILNAMRIWDEGGMWFGPVLGGPGMIDIMSLPKSIKPGQLFDWVCEGKLRVAPATEFALADAAEAQSDGEPRNDREAAAPPREPLAC